MKGIILVIAFVMLVASMFAQTGLFGLSYGQTLKEANKILVAKGFKEVRTSDDFVRYSNPKLASLTDLVVNNYGKNGIVSGWTAYYKVNDDPKQMDILRAEIDAIHKTYSSYDNVFEERCWELGNDHAVYLKYLSKDTIIIDYSLSYDYEDF
jgi:hypothetical protein